MFKFSHIQTLAILLITCFIATNVAAVPVACTGVKKTCTLDKKYDKTIQGDSYSCYDCKQVLCNSANEDSIVGTSTTSVCEAKPTGFTPIRQDDQFSGSTNTNSEPRTPVKRSAKDSANSFDEADAIFGKRRSASKPTSERSATPRQRIRLESPKHLRITDVKQREITFIWKDNANNEHGVVVERGIPKKNSNGTNYNWEALYKVEERIEKQVKGSGRRHDTDDGVRPGTEYCYRIRAYRDDNYSNYSNIVCAKTIPHRMEKRKSDIQDHRKKPKR